MLQTYFPNRKPRILVWSVQTYSKLALEFSLNKDISERWTYAEILWGGDLVPLYCALSNQAVSFVKFLKGQLWERKTKNKTIFNI